MVLWGCHSFGRNSAESKQFEVRRNLHNEDLHTTCYPPSFVRVVRSWRTLRTEHVTRMVNSRSVYKILFGKIKKDIHETGKTKTILAKVYFIHHGELRWTSSWIDRICDALHRFFDFPILSLPLASANVRTQRVDMCF